jgi:hypothetical protein
MSSGTLSSVASILRTLVSAALLGLLGTGGYFAWQAYDERSQLNRELAEKSAEVARLNVENEKLNLAMRLLKVDHRIAQIDVLDQTTEGDRPSTRFRFVELAGDGSPIGTPKDLTVEGDTVYVDAWVIKYSDELVEKGDPMRSTSVCLFRRIFGEHQEPSQGFPLDAAGSRPAVYSQGNEMSALERDVWANFWEYANNPARAQKSGIRAAHGEAPSVRLQPGKRYRIELRASGGLTIVAEESPDKPTI